jgi:hypothetical protein
VPQGSTLFALSQIVQKLVQITTSGESLMDEEQLEAIVELLPNEVSLTQLRMSHQSRLEVNPGDRSRLLAQRPN